MFTKISFFMLLACSLGCQAEVGDSLDLPPTIEGSTCSETGACDAEPCENLLDSKCESSQSYVCVLKSDSLSEDLVWLNTTGVEGYDVCQAEPEPLPDGEGTTEPDDPAAPEPGSDPQPEPGSDPQPEPGSDPQPEPGRDPQPDPEPPPSSTTCDFSTAIARNVRVSNSGSTPFSGSCTEAGPREVDGGCYRDELYAECPGSNNTQFQSCFAGQWTNCP